MLIYLLSDFAFPSVLQTLLVSDNSVLNVADASYNPAASS